MRTKKMIKKGKWLLGLVILLVSIWMPIDEIHAQRGTVTGTITEVSNGEALTGVNVLVKGTTIGVTSDIDGNYSINVPSLQDTLVYVFLGFQSQEIPINGRTTIDVAMVVQIFSADEMIVVGYGSQRRSDVTGSVASVSSETISEIPITSLTDGIQGRIPGLDIVSSGAGPGAENSLLLRGQRSFTASNDPLIILDGSPYYGSMNDINPNDVESVNVLKDASSTAIYGARGANGVILITTKRGAIGAPQFRLESYSGPISRYGRIPYALAQEYAEFAREAFRAVGAYPEGYSAAHDAIIFDVIEQQSLAQGGEGLDYQDMLFEVGNQQQHQLSVSGGSEIVRYNVTGGFFENRGIIPGESFSRYSLRSNLDFKLSDKINAGASILLNSTLNKRESTRDIGNSGGALDQVFRSSPLGKLTDDEGNPTFQATLDGLLLNPFVDYDFDSYRWNRVGYGALINAFAIAQILPELSYRLNLGTNLRTAATSESAGSYSLRVQRGAPIASVDRDEDRLLLYESILTYDKTFKGAHQVTVTAVHGIQTERELSSGAGVSGLPYEASRYYNLGSATNVTGVRSGLEETALISYAGRVFYGYKSKYLVTLSLRADGASQFSPDNKWGYFPSVALAYNISEESFMQSTDGWLSELKIRAGYGETGNQAINPYQTQGGLIRTAYNFGSTAAFGYRPIELSNRELKWETTAVYNFGLDFDLWAGRISGSIDAYNTDTYDLLMFRFLPITSGYNQVLQNVGSTNNKGFEIALNTMNIDSGDFRWSSNLTYFQNKTKIVELYQGTEDDIGNLWFIGQPIGVIYDFNKIGIWQLSEAQEAARYNRKPGQIKVQDLNNDGRVTDADRMILGSRDPDWIANIGNNFSYKNWNLSFSTYIRWGGMTSVNGFAPFSKKRYNKIVFDYWTPTNPTNNYPRPDEDYEGPGLNGELLAYRDATYISLRFLSLGYQIPQSLLQRINVKRANVYLSGENLMYWTKSEVRDFNMKPDWAGDNLRYPATRTLALGINIDF